MKNLLYILILTLMGPSVFSQTDFYIGKDYIRTDSMNRAWYPFQVIDSIRFKNDNRLIIANPLIRPINFVSSEEESYRNILKEEPKDEESFKSFNRTYNIYENYEEYLIMFNNKSHKWDSLIIKENKYSNSMDMAVWIQNTTNDTILIPKQDGSLISILEAIDNNEWKPVEYWWSSWCGNSNSYLFLAPNNSIQIGVNNRIGNIKTRMRLKVHGYDNIYYSNEFTGYVSKEDFVLNNRTKLESLNDKYRINFIDSVYVKMNDDPIIIEQIE